MAFFKKVMTMVTAIALMFSNVAMGQTQDQNQRAAELISRELVRLKDRGDRFEDERGQALSIEQIVSGSGSTIVYIPADGKGLKFVHRFNREKQTAVVAVLKDDGTRLAARSIRIDPALSAEQTVLKIRETTRSLVAEVESTIASNGSNQAPGRAPASADSASIGIAVNLLLLVGLVGSVVVGCAKARGSSDKLLFCGSLVLTVPFILLLIARW